MKKVNIIRKSMGKVLSLIPVSLLVGGAIVVSFLFATGCKKGTNCPDGYDHSIMKSPPKYAMADDPCEEERNAVNIAVQDSAYWTNVVREKHYTALTEPKDIQDIFWADFNFEYVSGKTFIDTLTRSMYVIDLWKEMFDGTLPPTRNPETMEAFYESCVTQLDKNATVAEKRDALTECESNVGITEYEWVKDDCGGYWTIK